MTERKAQSRAVAATRAQHDAERRLALLLGLLLLPALLLLLIGP